MIGRRISAIILVVIMTLSLFSCKGEKEKDREYDEAEVLSAVAKLIERSYAVNELLYGRGLEYTDEGVGVYKMATEESLSDFGFSTISQMQDEIRAVYATSLAESMINSDVFSSIKVDDVIVGYTRYYQSTDEDGNPNGIMVKSDYDYPLKNSYTYSDSFEVSDVEGEVIVISALVTVTREDGVVKNENLKIRIIEEKSGWRLLTPTYVVYNKYTEIYDNLNK